jgi:O-methyltransferase
MAKMLKLARKQISRVDRVLARLDEDPIPKRIIDEVRQYTMVSQTSLAFAIESAKRAALEDHPGAIFIECGTWMGGCSFAMLLAQRYHLGRIVTPIWMFDSFQGLPPAQERDGPAAKEWQQDTKGESYFDNCAAPLDKVKAARDQFGFTEEECRIIPGWFSDTVPVVMDELKKTPVSLFRVDCDWFEPVKFVLDNIVPHVRPGARIILDDYYFWDGCARATHAFLAEHDHAYRIQSLPGLVGAWFEKVDARTKPI